MNTKKNIAKIALGFLFAFMLSNSNLYSQEYNLNNQASELIVSGTSSLHDWDIKAEQRKGSIVLDLSNKLQIQKLKFEVASESLKSGKGSMDKNTYKALNTKEYKNITFNLVDVKEVSDLGNGNYRIKSNGNLTIAGVTKKISLDFNLQVSTGKIVIKGEKELKMTDFNIDPPKALLGTITTGNEITIKFNIILNQ